MPADCLTHGYAGYAKAGFDPPRETNWSKHVSDRLATVGGFMVVNTAGALHSSMPDVLLHTNSSMYYIEMKGEDTPVRANQVTISQDFNAKSLYSRGELTCFVYRAPDTLGVFRKDKSILKLTSVDALCSPDGFIDAIDYYSQWVKKGTSTNKITELISELDLYALPLSLYRVGQYRKNANRLDHMIQTYSEQLAAKQVLGLTHASSLALYGGSLFDWSVQEMK